MIGAVHAGVNPHNTDRHGRVLSVCSCERYYFFIPPEWVREGCFVSCGTRGCGGQRPETFPNVRPKRRTPRHGLRSTYVNGCRCGACRAAERIYKRHRRQAQKADTG